MKPLLYRPASKWRFGVAFMVAAAIHLSALAFAPTRRASATWITGGLPDVELEPVNDPEPQPEPQQLELPPPQLEQPNEFPEIQEQRQTRPTRTQQPIRAYRAAMNVQKGPSTPWKLVAISAPIPHYPYEARRDHITGSGAVFLDVDPITGRVINAKMIESTGSPILDNSAISGFRRWRFKNGTPSPVKIPFIFTMSGAHF